MKTGIVGIGLIGGSMAKAYKEAGHEVYAADKDSAILEMSQLAGVTDGELNADTIGECDLILLCIYPGASVKWLEDNAQYIAKTAMVIDCCGVKRKVCEPCFAIAEKYGFTYAGGHPMEGLQNSGYKYSRADLFKGASMVIVPPNYEDIELLERIKNILAPAQFGRITVSNAEEHDRIIAFTSQMAHVVSNAYIKSSTAKTHKGFSAGSYKDLTRVAKLDEVMWTELFLDNADNLVAELDGLIASLKEYRSALESGDADTLQKLLAEGRRLKEEVDG